MADWFGDATGVTLSPAPASAGTKTIPAAASSTVSTRTPAASGSRKQNGTALLSISPASTAAGSMWKSGARHIEFDSSMAGTRGYATLATQPSTLRPGFTSLEVTTVAGADKFYADITTVTGLLPGPYVLEWWAVLSSIDPMPYVVCVGNRSWLLPSSALGYQYRTDFYSHGPDEVHTIHVEGGIDSTVTSVVIDHLTVRPNYSVEAQDYDGPLQDASATQWSADRSLSGNMSAYGDLDLRLNYNRTLWPGCDYTYGVWVWVPSDNTGPAELRLEDWKNQVSQQVFSTVRDQWEYMEMTTTSEHRRLCSGSAGTPRLLSAGGDYIYADSLRVTRTGEVSSTVFSDDFEAYSATDWDANWYWKNYDDEPVIAEVNAAAAHSGTKSLEISLPADDGPYAHTLYSTPGINIYHHPWYYDASYDVTIRVWVYVPSPNNAVSLAVWNTSGTYPDFTYLPPVATTVSTLHDQWEQISLTITAQQWKQSNGEAVIISADGAAISFRVDDITITQPRVAQEFTGFIENAELTESTITLSGEGEASPVVGTFIEPLGIMAYGSVRLSYRYRGPLSIPAPPEPVSETNPVQATGFVMRPLYGSIITPNHDPTISGGKPT